MVFLLTGYSETDSILKLIGLIVLCILVLIASYYTTKFVGKSQMKKQNGSNFQIIDACRLSQNKMLQLVRAGNKYLVLAVCKDNIQVLTELNESDIEIFSNTKGNIKFKDVLSNITGKKKNDNITKDDNITKSDTDKVDTDETEED